MTAETKDRAFKGRQYRQQIMDKLSVETSTAETFKPGNDKDNYLKILDENLEKLKSMIDDMKEKSINPDLGKSPDSKRDFLDTFFSNR
jgi:hypothetical protein